MTLRTLEHSSQPLPAPPPTLTSLLSLPYSAILQLLDCFLPALNCYRPALVPRTRCASVPQPQVQVRSLQNLEPSQSCSPPLPCSPLHQAPPISNTPPAWHGVPKTSGVQSAVTVTYGKCSVDRLRKQMSSACLVSPMGLQRHLRVTRTSAGLHIQELLKRANILV